MLFFSIETPTGTATRKPVFLTDLVSMKTVSAAVEPAATTPTLTDAGAAIRTAPAADAVAPGSKRQLFILPLDGTVGIGLRAEDMVKIADVADKYGDGQIIVLHINSNGGLVIEGDQIHEVLKRVKKRHRLISWIEKAISGGAFTAVQADEIYFMPQGSLGSITMIQGLTAVTGAANEAWEAELERVFEEMGGQHGYIGRCMVTKEHELSYDKDPDTGKITWYKTMEGEFDLSDKTENLCFSSSNALHCGFSKGVAGTQEELAAALGLEPGTYEVNQEGKKIYEKWQRILTQCEKEVPRIYEQMNYKNTASGDEIVILGTRIALFKKLLEWYDRCYEFMVFELGMPQDKEPLVRQLSEMEKQLADMRKARRQGGQ
ncbi:MAG: hypothetical protein EXS00_07365 [Phycisphaerales bacterium]|nr:hypothetical protein [Phycisphaerales bacterium]